MGNNHDSSPFLFASNFPSYPSESTPTLPPSSSPPFCSSQSTSSLVSPYKSSSSPPRQLHSRSSSSHLPPAAFGPCATCKFHNRRCSENCYLASFLPPNEVHKLAVVDSVFGSGHVGNFLQQNSNSSYIPLLLLLKDTSQDDGELNLDHKNNALSETEAHSQLGFCVGFEDEFRIRELIEEFKVRLNSALPDINGDHLVQKLFSSFDKTLSILNWSGLQNSDALIDTASNDPESPIHMCDSPGTESVNFDEVYNEPSKKIKTMPTLTRLATVSYDEKSRLTIDQGQPLEKNFQDEYKLEPERKIPFPKDLGLQPRQVAIWSHNGRATWKTKQLEKNYEELQSNYNSLMANYDTLLKEKDKLNSEVNLLTDKLFYKE